MNSNFYDKVLEEKYTGIDKFPIRNENNLCIRCILDEHICHCTFYDLPDRILRFK